MARIGASGRRYAEAAFDLAVRDDTVDEWLDQLDRAATIGRDEDVARILENPALPLRRREEVLERALGKNALPPLRNLCALLLRRGRIDLLPQVARAFRQLQQRREGITEALITSALPLDDDEVRQITERLERRTGGRVEAEVEVDPSLLGGLQVRLGDRLIDGSVRGRLERLRARLVAGTI
ncbi:MAG TPA: F0F1 ATP synthase subunit delta [Candidatus Limnocylindrales bacterium]|jgi:F-type H+-transporting ATPase subunit delta|nr:F0F1 ATP synthase subunit delta [Candidatus Limnocylindrales bacterium]